MYYATSMRGAPHEPQAQRPVGAAARASMA